MITVKRQGDTVEISGHADDARVCAAVAMLTVGMHKYSPGLAPPVEGSFQASLENVPDSVVEFFDLCIETLASRYPDELTRILVAD